jgi:two-component sensor histidine kinase
VGGFQSIVTDAVAPYRHDQITLDGGPVRLTPKAALTLSMVLHELATNAAKYGALSVPEGRLAICWSVDMEDGARHLKLVWQETGGPEVAAPTRKGFGSKLIERSIAQDLGGVAESSFDPAGLRYTCDVVLSR